MGEICRICMTANRNLIKLVKEGSNKLERSGEKFEDCFGIKIKQIQNCQKICRTCEQTLIEFYYFKQQALRTHNYLIDKAVSLPVDRHEIKKVDDLDCTKLSDDEEDCSNVEFFNIEYLDEDAVDVDLMLPLPKIENIPEFENLEIKQEKIDEHEEAEEEDCVENATSENFDEGTIFGYTNESQTDLIADYDDESLENSIFMEDQEEEELSKLSEKDQSDEENSKENFKKYFKRSVRYRHRCEECVRNFKSDKAYKEHLKRHKEEDGYIPTEDELAVGRQNISQKNKKKYSKKSRFKHKCNECGKNFLHDFSYEAHKNVHKGLAPFNCNICGKGFKQKINYTYHMKNHLGKRDWKCDICGKAFLVKWDLDLHMRSHTDARPFMCDICGKGFRISTHLTNHRETHNETNIYECHLCKTRLHTKITLKRHMASLHKIGKLKHCPYCDKEFVRLDRFKIHISKYHDESILSLKSSSAFKDDSIVDVLNAE